ncbi:1-acyl-sn-glycerol-3-phosphate acyltransferase [Abortiporus biennis]
MSIFGYVVKPLAYVSVPVFLLHKFADVSPFARYYIRLTLYLSTLGLCSVWGAMCAVGMSLVGQRFNAHWVTARSFYYLASRAVDINVEIEGEEYLETRPAVLVANHQSMVDILVLGRVFPKRGSIMAKKELKWAPLLGQFMTLSGAVFVDRGNNAQAVRSLTAAGEAMRNNNISLWLFPEGTRSMRPYNDMLPFKKGAFHTAVNAGVPILPVIVENYWKLYRKGVFEAGTIKVKVLPPIDTTGLTAADVGTLSERVRDSMIVALKEISRPTPTPSPSNDDDEKPYISTPPHPPPSPPSQIQIQPSQQQPIIIEASSRSESRASASSTNVSEEPSSPALSRLGDNSENGVETEEDEGMVLVGRPKP